MEYLIYIFVIFVVINVAIYYFYRARAKENELALAKKAIEYSEKKAVLEHSLLWQRDEYKRLIRVHDLNTAVVVTTVDLYKML